MRDAFIEAEFELRGDVTTECADVRGLQRDRHQLSELTMPFKSKAQRAYLEIHKPELAKEFEKGTPKKLPKHVKKPKDSKK
jgi:hypothetical protein